MSYKVNSRALGILTGITLGSCLLITLYYFYFAQKLFFIPFSFTIEEGLHLFKALNKPSFFNLYESLIFKFANDNSIAEILKTGRTLNIFALGLQLASLMLILKKEKVDFLASSISLLIFLSFTSIQTIFYQATPEFWALAIGNLGLYLFMQNLKSWNLFKGIFISLILSLPFFLTYQISFLTFPLTVILTLVFLKNYQIALKILWPSLIICLVYISFAYKNLLFFKPQFNNLELLYAWPLWSFCALIIFIRPTLKANYKHPAFILFFISFILSWFQPNIWPITFSALCWIIALFLQTIIAGANSKKLYLIGIFVLCLGIFTPLLETIPLKLLNENPQIISKTINWISEEKNNDSKILSQDISIALYLNSQKALFKPPEPDILEIEQINKIILSAKPELIWDQKIIAQIKQKYILIGRIFVLGTEGFIFETKWTNDSEKEGSNKEVDDKNIFATFHPI